MPRLYSLLLIQALVVGACDRPRTPASVVELVGVFALGEQLQLSVQVVSPLPRRDLIWAAGTASLYLDSEDSVQVDFLSDRQSLGRRWLEPGVHAVVVSSAWIEGLPGTQVPVAWLLGGSAPGLLGMEATAWPHFPLSVGVAGGEASSSACLAPMSEEASIVRAAVESLNESTRLPLFLLSGAVPSCGTAVDVVVHVGETLFDQLGRTNVIYRPCLDQGTVGVGFGDCVLKNGLMARVRLDKRATIAEAQHELLHVLGLGHSCVVPSVMATEFSADDLEECGRARYHFGMRDTLLLRRQLSDYDVAAARVAYHVSNQLVGLHVQTLRWVVLPDEAAGR